ncbi:sugar phosphate isomerase/epimerase family protein [Arthrobacter bambusae]|uniref:sugar phosphate isomerase/epimerase family protein n=1 Tax=Arthrobacter bambusae TaxID=1338426 RepID=UPI002789B617|nr:TIM barrel protein [Arthrobacter bambusae]MDQ0239527.1 sugar phosphate isomerase/epimerase [Arthrobacter bambusae]
MTAGLLPGLCTRDLQPGDDDLANAIRAVHDIGFRHCHVSTINHEISNEELGTARNLARYLGIGLSAGIGAINPSYPERNVAAMTLGDGDLTLGLMRLLGKCRRFGATQAHFTIGTLADRADRETPWDIQLNKAAGLLEPLARHAASLGIDLVLKTHEEMTTFELDRLLAGIGATNLGAGFSPVNIVTRLEDPLHALYRLANHIKAVMVDDAELHWTGQGIRRSLLPLGQGDIPWGDILAIIAAGRPEEGTPVILDLHRAELETPIFEHEWAQDHPDLTPAEISVSLGHIRTGRPHAPASPTDRLDHGLHHLLRLETHHTPDPATEATGPTLGKSTSGGRIGSAENGSPVSWRKRQEPNAAVY